MQRKDTIFTSLNAKIFPIHIVHRNRRHRTPFSHVGVLCIPICCNPRPQPPLCHLKISSACSLQDVKLQMLKTSSRCLKIMEMIKGEQQNVSTLCCLIILNNIPPPKKSNLLGTKGKFCEINQALWWLNGDLNVCDSNFVPFITHYGKLVQLFQDG